MDPSSPNGKEKGPEAETEAKISKCFHLFNCDTTYKFDSVDKLLESIKEKLNFDISIAQHYFQLGKMSETCERINSEPQMDFAIFVVHAHESRLSINEDNAGIGYAKIYRALLQKTGEKVIIVIGGDDNYKNSTQEQTAVLSRWAYRKVSSQFDEQFLDGRKSFIFSWDKEYRPIHEEALLHFCDPSKKGKKFIPEPKVKSTVPEVDPPKGVSQSHESSTTNAEENSNVIETQTSEGQEPETSNEQRMLYQRNLKQIDEPTADNPESDGLPQEQRKTDEDNDRYVWVRREDVPGPAGLAQCQARDIHESVLILYREQSDITFMKDIFGERLQGMAPVTNNDPSDSKDFLSNQSVKSCVIFVEAKTMQGELQKRSDSTPYEDLLRTVREKVDAKVVIFLCYNNFSGIKADDITATIKDLLVGKDVTLLWKQNDSTTRSPTDATQGAPPVNPEDLTLLLKTRLRHGKISYDEKDVEERKEGWTAPQKMADELQKRWQSTINAELRISLNTKTGDHDIVVKEDENNAVNTVKETWQCISSSLPSRPRLPLFGSGNTSPPKDGPAVD